MSALVRVFPQKRKSQVVVFEGVPGCGKSSAVARLALYLKSLSFEVFVHEEKPDPFFLGLYLSDMPRYAFAFQIHMATERRVAMRDAMQKVQSQDNTIVILDRSIAGDWAFERHLRKIGWISEKENGAYRAISGVPPGCTLAMQYPAEWVKVLYLSVTPETSLRRVATRGNASEISAYDTAYMSSLQKAYEEVLDLYVPGVQTIDWNTDVTMQKDADGTQLPEEAIVPLVKLLNL